MRLRPIVGQPGNSSRVKLTQTTVQLGKRAGFDDVEQCLGLTTGAQISVCKVLSFYKPRSALDRYRNGSGETTVVKGTAGPVERLGTVMWKFVV